MLVAGSARGRHCMLEAGSARGRHCMLEAGSARGRQCMCCFQLSIAICVTPALGVHNLEQSSYEHVDGTDMITIDDMAS